MQNASDFGSDHPEFRIAVLSEDAIVAPGQWRAQWLEASNAAAFKEASHLKFSHAQHLNPKGIGVAAGRACPAVWRLPSPQLERPRDDAYPYGNPVQRLPQSAF